MRSSHETHQLPKGFENKEYVRLTNSYFLQLNFTDDAEGSALPPPPPVLTGLNPPVPPSISIAAPVVDRLGRRDDPINPLIGTMNMCTWWVLRYFPLSCGFYADLYYSNSIGFNIWSACRYSMGFAEQPALNEWMSACKNASVDLPGALALSSEPEGLGFRAPPWALIPAPGGRYFDMQSATRSRHLSFENVLS